MKFQSTIKNLILFGLFSLPACIFLVSCKKEKLETSIINVNTETSVKTNSVFQRTNTKSTVTVEKALSWLNSQKMNEDSAVNRNNFISTIASNLITDNLMAWEWGDEDFMITIPIKAKVTKHEEGKNASSYLVMFEDKNGSITRGEIAIITKDYDTAKIGQESMVDLYLNNNIDFSGTLQLVSFQDFEFYKKKYEGELNILRAHMGND